ncbi:hypothetical protein PIB30_104348, partial [Stylosanthes scabra]|nr:hypothetical protein [Stylosanthes scabra]
IEFGLHGGLTLAPILEIPILAVNLGVLRVQVAWATREAAQATLLLAEVARATSNLAVRNKLRTELLSLQLSC